ncbi:hypothetical protein FACS1894208_00510 [Clostridia bacterium]|nr:hypothetical protein FACS1894208_00510 [Clostridia bacterium]
MLLVNSSVTGVESVGLNVLGDVNIAKQQEVVFVCNKNAKEFPSSVYAFLRDCLRQGKRLFLVAIGGCEHQLFSNLMASFGAYDIYSLPDEGMLTERYIRGITSRKCGIEDVSQYVGCDVLAYGMLDSVLLKLAERADELDISDADADVLIGGAEVLTYLKTVDAEFNYKEKDGVIADLRSSLARTMDAKSLIESELALARENIGNLTSRLEVARARVDELETISPVAQMTAVRGAMVVQPACPVDTLMTETKHILYFKELTQIPYINTFIKYLADYIRTRKIAGKRLVCKLAIFDFNGTQKMYHPIPLVSGDEYMVRRTEMAGSRMEMAVSTPQMAVLSDILTGKYGGADTVPDVLVVYDRTRQNEEIVRGKTVTKFFVCHSRASIERLAEDYGVKDLSRVITRSDVYIHDTQLDIPRISDYASFESDSRRKRAYLGLTTRYGHQPLMDSVLNAAGIVTQ